VEKKEEVEENSTRFGAYPSRRLIVEIENEAGSFDDGSVSRVHQGQRHCLLVGLLLCTREAMQVSRGLAGGGAAAGI